MSGAECVSAPGFTLGPGGFNCTQLVAGNYCDSTGGEGPAWDASQWGALSRFETDGLTAAKACCGCGREVYLTAMGNATTADCVWVPSEVSLPSSSSWAYKYSCSAVVTVAASDSGLDNLGVATVVLVIMVVVLGAAAIASYVRLKRGRNRPAKVSAETVLGSQVAESPPPPPPSSSLSSSSSSSSPPPPPSSSAAAAGRASDHTPSKKHGWKA